MLTNIHYNHTQYLQSENMGCFLAPDQRDAILFAMQLLENLTAVDAIPCVQFRPKVVEDGEYFIFIYNGDGCNSYVMMKKNSLSSLNVILILSRLDACHKLKD